jgi:hypothetical protein
MTRIETPWGPWEHANLAEVTSLLSHLQCPWWTAGGYAIELAVGHPVREHGDIDVMMLRRDQLALQHILPGWQWQAADPPGTLRPWNHGELLPAGIHDIWCRPTPDAPWRIQVMLDEAAEDQWISRRDGRIHWPIPDIGKVSGDDVPYLAPEVQLFYKARQPRPKDRTDFTAVLPLLTQAQRRWLAEAIACCYGDHPRQR